MTVKIKLNSKGVAALLKSAPVLADLEARANRIADAAGEGMEATAQVGATRARASVATGTFQARANEANDRALSSALDAGR